MRLRKRNSDSGMAHGRSAALAKTADALAHPLRVEMFSYIIKCNRDRITVRNKDLVKASGYSQATISQHINVLTDGGLLTAVPQGTSTCYYANIGIVTKFVNELMALGEL